MSKAKKTGKRDTKVKRSKAAPKSSGNELTEDQLGEVAGGLTLTGVQGESTSKGHEKEIHIESWSWGTTSPSGGTNQR